MRIAYIDPVGPKGAYYFIKNELERFVDQGNNVDFFCLKRGPDNLEYRYYEALIIPDLIHLLLDLEGKGYDAAIIGCFFDPGLDVAKEMLTKMIVVGVAEASLIIAKTLGESISIIVGREKHIPKCIEVIKTKGIEGKITSIQSLGYKVNDMANNSVISELIEKKALEAITNDLADVIVLGCTLEVGHYEELQQKLNIPVIDPVVASLKYAEFLVEIKNTCKWFPSKKYAYERLLVQALHN